MKNVLMLTGLLVVLCLTGMAVAGENPKVLMKTNMGEIELELWPDKAPNSVQNFLDYVNSGFYSGVIFHRVINGFMIQGGGFDANMGRKETNAPIINEATNGESNKRGTLSYARTGVINSATSQFFINHKDNAFLDHRDDTAQGFGYAVFGKVTKGMDVVDAIAKVKTTSKNGMGDVPVKPVVIESVTVIQPEE